MDATLVHRTVCRQGEEEERRVRNRAMDTIPIALIAGFSAGSGAKALCQLLVRSLVDSYRGCAVLLDQLSIRLDDRESDSVRGSWAPLGVALGP